MTGKKTPDWYETDATFEPTLGIVETVEHHYWNDVGDWRWNYHAEDHIIAEGHS